MSAKLLPERLRRGDVEIQDVTSWILRVGVVSSVGIMLLGLALSVARGSPSVAEMRVHRFSGDFGLIWRGCLRGDGASVVELGILVLVLTPIMRVASSMVLFAVEERDWLYFFITLSVLAMSLLSLIILR